MNELWTSLSFCCATSWFGRQSSGLKEWHVMRNQGPSGKINDQIKRDVNGLRPQSCTPLLQPCCGNTKAGTLPPPPQTHTWSKVHVLGLPGYDPFIWKQRVTQTSVVFPIRRRKEVWRWRETAAASGVSMKAAHLRTPCWVNSTPAWVCMFSHWPTELFHFMPQRRTSGVDK